MHTKAVEANEVQRAKEAREKRKIAYQRKGPAPIRIAPPMYMFSKPPTASNAKDRREARRLKRSEARKQKNFSRSQKQALQREKMRNYQREYKRKRRALQVSAGSSSATPETKDVTDIVVVENPTQDGWRPASEDGAMEVLQHDIPLSESTQVVESRVQGRRSVPVQSLDSGITSQLLQERDKKWTGDLPDMKNHFDYKLHNSKKEMDNNIAIQKEQINVLMQKMGDNGAICGQGVALNSTIPSSAVRQQAQKRKALGEVAGNDDSSEKGIKHDLLVPISTKAHNKIKTEMQCDNALSNTEGIEPKLDVAEKDTSSVKGPKHVLLLAAPEHANKKMKTEILFEKAVPNKHGRELKSDVAGKHILSEKVPEHEHSVSASPNVHKKIKTEMQCVNALSNVQESETTSDVTGNDIASEKGPNHGPMVSGSPKAHIKIKTEMQYENKLSNVQESELKLIGRCLWKVFTVAGNDTGSDKGPNYGSPKIHIKIEREMECENGLGNAQEREPKLGVAGKDTSSEDPNHDCMESASIRPNNKMKTLMRRGNALKNGQESKASGSRNKSTLQVGDDISLTKPKNSRVILGQGVILGLAGRDQFESRDIPAGFVNIALKKAFEGDYPLREPDRKDGSPEKTLNDALASCLLWPEKNIKKRDPSS